MLYPAPLLPKLPTVRPHVKEGENQKIPYGKAFLASKQKRENSISVSKIGFFLWWSQGAKSVLHDHR